MQCRPPDRPRLRPDGGRLSTRPVLGPPPAALQTTTDDRRRTTDDERQTTNASEQNNTGSLGGPVMIRQLPLMLVNWKNSVGLGAASP